MGDRSRAAVLPHHDDGGGEDPRPLRRLGQLFQRGTDGGRVGGAAPRDHGGGGVRGPARRHQPLDDGGELGQAHEDDQGALYSGQPVQLVGGLHLLCGR